MLLRLVVAVVGQPEELELDVRDRNRLLRLSGGGVWPIVWRLVRVKREPPVASLSSRGIYTPLKRRNREINS